MLEVARILNAASKKVAATTAIAMQRFQRQATWGLAAVAALFIAIQAGRSDIGAQRTAIVLSSLNLASSPALRPGETSGQVSSQSNPRTLDTDPVNRQLVQSVRGLAEDRDRMLTRLAAIEHNLDDMTGSISRQIEAVKASGTPAPAPWPSDQTATANNPANVAPVVAPDVPPPGGLAAPLQPSPSTLTDGQAPLEAAAAVPPLPAVPVAQPAYGAEIASASSIKTLYTRWAGIRAAHAQLLEGLRPVVTLKDNARSKRIELRLVLGPLASAAAAEELCTSLAAFKMSCEATMFDARQPALE